VTFLLLRDGLRACFPASSVSHLSMTREGDSSVLTQALDDWRRRSGPIQLGAIMVTNASG